MDFISIKDSAILTSKSESTIKRFVKEVQNSTKKKGDLVKKIKFDLLKNGSRKVLINKDFLLEYFQIKDVSLGQNINLTSSNEPLNNDTSLKIIELLEHELKDKSKQIDLLNKQIDVLNKQISELIERQKESNILLLESKSLRQLEQDTRKKKWFRFWVK